MFYSDAAKLASNDEAYWLVFLVNKFSTLVIQTILQAIIFSERQTGIQASFVELSMVNTVVTLFVILATLICQPTRSY